MILRDPNTQIGMNINSDNQGEVNGVALEESLFVNKEKQESYSAVIAATPTGAGDCFFYMTNENDLSLIITDIRLQSATAESVQVKLGDSGTVGGTHAALTPVNRTSESGKAAQVTTESGVDITGFSGGLIADLVYGGATMVIYEWKSGLIVPKNKIISLYAVTGAVAIKATLGFYFR